VLTCQGSLAVQYAKYLGFKVIAVDTGAAKEKLVKELGADAWIDFATAGDMIAAYVTLLHRFRPFLFFR
jgi:D-arabinose 1-dehydrogenase-like Zn-dependent alcohol dehydrogenase